MPPIRQRPGGKPANAEPKPWRVEGHPEGEAAAGGERRSMLPQAGRGFWRIFLAVLVLNFVLSLVLSGGTERLSVPYTLFYGQVEQGNVREISSKGDEIQGTFRAAVRYPLGKGAKKNRKFHTVRPTFGDDGLSKLLLAKKVSVNAHAVDSGTPLWQTIVFGFGPTLLLVGLFVALARRTSAGGMLVLRAIGRASLRALGAADLVQGRGRHRRGRGGVDRGRRLPAQPWPLYEGGRRDPQGRAACGPPRDRQGAARARRGR